MSILCMALIDINNIHNFLKVLDFKIKDGTENTYWKKYQDGYKIEIIIDKDNFRSSKINYGDKIIIDRATTTNFSQ